LPAPIPFEHYRRRKFRTSAAVREFILAVHRLQRRRSPPNFTKVETVSYIQLIHWNAAEARDLAERLKAAGYEVTHELPQGMSLLRQLRADLPRAVVIDLTRLPMQGRDVALGIRHDKTTRHLPIVFVGGEPAKVERVREKIPDAVYATWSGIKSALQTAIAYPPAAPVVPKSLLDGYSGRPLTKKLGIKPDSVVACVEAPPVFKKTLGALPRGVKLHEQPRGRCDLMLWFVRSPKALQNCVRRMSIRDDFGALWIAWPKKTSGMRTELTQQMVRAAGLAAGLVDYKICAIDTTWSGLLFTRRKAQKNV
jgi:hypothetical protein